MFYSFFIREYIELYLHIIITYILYLDMHKKFFIGSRSIFIFDMYNYFEVR
jgi:hypothetical protein